MKYLLAAVALSAILLGCTDFSHQARRNAIQKVEFATYGCFGECPIQNIRIDSTLTIYYQGVEYTDRKEFYQGKVTPGFWDTLNLKFEHARFRQLDTSYNQTVDDLATEVLIYYGNHVKRIHGQSFSIPDSLQSAYRWLLGSLNTIKLQTASEPLTFGTHEEMPPEATPPLLTCLHPELSTTFDYRLTSQRMVDEDHIQRTSVITIAVLDKTNKQVQQEVVFHPGFLLESAFMGCSAVRSYVTGANKDAEVPDNDYGGFIVADFNFDQKEDFAIKRDSGGNGGPLYDFFLQDAKGQFNRDAFLSDTVAYFPETRDAKHHWLTTYVHADAYGYSETTYSYQRATKRWRLVESKYRKAE